MRGQYLLIRRLRALLVTRMSKSGHLLQVVRNESRGNCLPPSRGCSSACREAAELIALTEPYLRPAEVKPIRQAAQIVLRRPQRRARRAVVQPGLFEAS